MRKALIIGINGFVGSYLRQYLIDNGFSVDGMDLSSGGFVDYSVDIRDSKQVLGAVQKSKPDVIFHLAAQSSVSASLLKPELTNEVNVEGTRNILDVVKAVVPNAKVIVAGSADVYGVPDNVPVKEDVELKPVSPYGKSRFEQEKLILGYKLNCIILRLFPHIGPGQSPIFAVSNFAKQLSEIELSGEGTLKTGDLSVRRDISDVRDVVKAYLSAIDNCECNTPYNVCSSHAYELREVDILLSNSEAKVEVVQEKGRLRKNDIPVMLGDNSKFFSATKWRPEIPINDTLRDVLNYWRNMVKNSKS